MPNHITQREPAEPRPKSPPADGLLAALDDALTPDGVAQQFGVHFKTIYRWMDRGVDGVKLPYLKLGGRQRRVTQEDLAAFIAALTSRSRDASADPPPSPAWIPKAVATKTAEDRELDEAGW